MVLIQVWTFVYADDVVCIAHPPGKQLAQRKYFQPEAFKFYIYILNSFIETNYFVIMILT